MKTLKCGRILSVLIFALSLFSCSKQNDPLPQLSTEKSLLTFGFRQAENPSLAMDYTAQISANMVTMSLPSSVDRSSLVANFSCSEKAVVKIGTRVQQSRVSRNDFTSALTFTVYAEDGTSANYTVNVNRLPSEEKKLKSFVFEKAHNPQLGYDVSCTIDENNKKIICTYPELISRQHLISTFEVSEFASLKSGDSIQHSARTPQDYTTPPVFKVVAEDGTVSTYSVEFRAESTPILTSGLITAKVKELNAHRLAYNGPTDPFVAPQIEVVTPSVFQSSKPNGTLPFECGYVATNGKIYVSKPIFPAQTEIFTSIDQVAVFYLSQQFLHFYYTVHSSPLWFRMGFGLYESGARPDDALVLQSLNAYGSELTSFASLNDTTRFRQKKGIMLAYLFGEFMCVYRMWGYPDVLEVHADHITTAPWISNIETTDKLYAMWQRYVNYRLIKTGTQRLKWQGESTNFRFLYRDAEAYNFPAFANLLQSAYSEYAQKLQITHPSKLSYVTLLEADFATIDGVPCPGRYTGGTAWTTGVSSTCAANTADYNLFVHLLRHELAHSFQAILAVRNTIPAWLNEGFPQFMAQGGPMNAQRKAEVREPIKEAMLLATDYFHHRPSWQDIYVYPSPYFDYYGLGQVMYEFIYSKAGYSGVIEITKNPVNGVAYLGYSGTDAFMTAFYEYFDANWK